MAPRDDLAVLVGCSTDTISRDEKKHHLNVGDALRTGRLCQSEPSRVWRRL
jgi:hypothetical protein